MTEGTRRRISIFNKAALEWLETQPILSANLQSAPSKFIYMDEHEHINVWIGFLDPNYATKHIIRNVYGYADRFAEQMRPMLEKVCAEYGRRNHAFPVHFQGSKENVFKVIGVEVPRKDVDYGN